MAETANAQTVHRYFDACNSGDFDALMSTLDGNVVHYFLAETPKPIRGAEHLARFWCKFHSVYKPIWRIDHTAAAGDEVVAEWSCAYLSQGKEQRVMFRGTDWYLLRAGRIVEVRAYYQFDQSRDCELIAFPYGERGYLMKGAH